jgi:tetratricopeptide (TPR) repeat protein
MTHRRAPALPRLVVMVLLGVVGAGVATGAHAAATQADASKIQLRERLNRIGTDVFSHPERARDSIRELKDILAADPNLSEGHLLLGLAYRTLGSSDMVGEAKAELVQAVALDPTNLPARYYLANIYIELGRPEKAREELESALKQLPGRPQFLALLGEAERQLKNPQRAVELTRQALQADANFVQARYYLALALFDTGERDQAIQELEQVVASQPPLADPYLSLATAYVDAKRLDDAIAALQRAVQIDKARQDVHIQLARAYRLKGLPARADQELALAAPSATQGPGSSSFDQQHVDSDFYLETGLLRLQQGRLTAASQALRKVLDMDPDHGPANRGLAEVYLRQGSYARAAEYAERAQKLGAPLSDANRKLLQSHGAGGK